MVMIAWFGTQPLNVLTMLLQVIWGQTSADLSLIRVPYISSLYGYGRIDIDSVGRRMADGDGDDG